MMAVSLTPNSDIAAVVSAAFYGIWNLFGGFAIPRTRLPAWWSWYYWACPISWSVYGLIGSQFGDMDNVTENGETVKDFTRRFFGYKYEFLGVVAVAVIAFPLLFAIVFAFGIKVLNFQKR